MAAYDRCSCKAGCGSVQCACRKAGRSCSVGCTCLTIYTARYAPCRSPFDKLPELFEAEPPPPEYRNSLASALLWGGARADIAPVAIASPCFTKYLNRKDHKVDVDDLKTKLLKNCDAFELDPNLAAWRAKYNAMERRQEGQEKLFAVLQALFTHALSVKNEDRDMRGDNMLDTYVWSFCRNGWVDRSKVRHCTLCNECYEEAWHCETCDTCKAGRKLACDRCGGWSKLGAEEGINGELAVDVHTVQGGGSGRKRGRSSTVVGQSTEVCTVILKARFTLNLRRPINVRQQTYQPGPAPAKTIVRPAHASVANGEKVVLHSASVNRRQPDAAIRWRTMLGTSSARIMQTFDCSPAWWKLKREVVNEICCMALIFPIWKRDC